MEITTKKCQVSASRFGALNVTVIGLGEDVVTALSAVKCESLGVNQAGKRPMFSVVCSQHPVAMTALAALHAPETNETEIIKCLRTLDIFWD